MVQQQYEQLLAAFEQHASDSKKARYLAFFRNNDASSEVAVPMLVKETANWFKTADSEENYLGDIKKSSEDEFRKGYLNERTNLKGILEYKDLPEDLQRKYDRIQEIMPLRASLHAEMKSETIKEAARKKIAKELSNIDDERIALWADMDAFEKANNVQLWHRKMKKNEESEGSN